MTGTGDRDVERERIMQAAYQCLAERRDGHVTITEILAAAGYSTRAFYRHFQSKDELFVAMYRRDGNRLVAEWNEIADAAPTPRRALHDIVVRWLEITTAPGRRAHVLAMTSAEARRADGYAEQGAHFDRLLEAVLERVLDTGRDDGSFPSTIPCRDARFVRAVLGMVFEEHMAGTADRTVDDTAAAVLDFILRALGASPSGA